ncbi:unnamed protein product [Bursaphelenchus xylophilus]|uniref:(pine wood nematode) hypothetical protein n=1 Tax=Bursaphelenchus xylophilus TaxID=6326 RepID=A0A1I7RXI6_BURXY|nr:unnamed protein product [Bursaphelenchus xylophilus]CAG9126459.1 unnamed protein product [Bursaphelenchus xylophilus]
MQSAVVLLLCTALLVPLASGKTYTVTVAGKVECCSGTRRPCPVYKDKAQVELWDRYKVGSDKLLSRKENDRNTGNILITGSTNSILLGFDPYVVIRHTCGAKPKCARKLTIPIPRAHVKIGKTFSIEHLDLYKPHLGRNEDNC